MSPATTDLVWPTPSFFCTPCAPSIAAASIIAKHTRDEMMVALDAQYPGYHWAQNKGYGVPAHRAGLAAQGVSPEHRRTFAPIRRLL